MGRGKRGQEAEDDDEDEWSALSDGECSCCSEGNSRSGVRSGRSSHRGSGSSSSRRSSDSSSPESVRSADAKAWAARRRDPRVNGADIYVARVTKSGMGSARPCWRCLEWCRWAGVKRIFHWNADAGTFDAVKVNSADPNKYETHADVRLFAGLGY
ncbi:unnamed protein product [Peniophora sp. CBMAI 1063]|nr:unnamed protein product [Peniophora sp. CBMAI 1063]